MSTIAAGNTLTTGFISTSDTTGNLVFQTNGTTTALTLTTGQNATFANAVTVTGNVTGGNILTTGIMSSTGNVTGNYVLGNGSQLTGVASFTSGTAMLFKQTAAPTGWTKSTTFNDYALRVVNGSAGNGGGVAFSTAFANTSVGNTTLATSQIPSHAHDVMIVGGPGSPPSYYYASTWGGPTPMIASGSTGGGGSHNHSLTLAVQYVDVIIATKD